MENENIVKKKKKKKKLDPNFDKEREKLKNFDPRGTQTLFRTMSRNHYNLLRMVDSKASIVLTINSIIISLLMGAMYVAPDSHKNILELGSKILLNFCLLSMIFALFSMLPHKYIGKLYRESEYKGSLHAANYSSLTLEEFKAEFERIMDSGKSTYDEMILDLYFLGQAITRKQKLLLFSVSLFLLGLGVTFIFSIINGLS